MGNILYLLGAAAIVAVLSSELIRMVRISIAHIKGDAHTANRLSYTYDECELIAYREYRCTPEDFERLFKELRKKDPKALPWDLIETLK